MEKGRSAEPRPGVVVVQKTSEIKQTSDADGRPCQRAGFGRWLWLRVRKLWRGSRRADLQANGVPRRRDLSDQPVPAVVTPVYGLIFGRRVPSVA